MPLTFKQTVAFPTPFSHFCLFANPRIKFPRIDSKNKRKEAEQNKMESEIRYPELSQFDTVQRKIKLRNATNKWQTLMHQQLA